MVLVGEDHEVIHSYWARVKGITQVRLYDNISEISVGVPTNSLSWRNNLLLPLGGKERWTRVTF